MPNTRLSVEPVQRLTEDQIEGLAQVLLDCVEGGASVSFLWPLPLEQARDFWRGVAQAVDRGERALWLAMDGAQVVGTVQLVLAQPPNQPHRADLSKMLVHRGWRQQGLGALLIQAAEAGARQHGKTLLVLDTASADAMRLYERCGWVRCGAVPGYALLPRGGLCDTVFYYRELGSPLSACA